MAGGRKWASTSGPATSSTGDLSKCAKRRSGQYSGLVSSPLSGPEERLQHRVQNFLERCHRGGLCHCQGANMDEVNRLLVSFDPIEIQMRALASQEYLARTGDRYGASQLLAVKPPGVGVDLAPGWLVSEVTQYSKAEHQRRERGESANRGRGRGRGLRQSGAPAPQQEQQGEAGERARGGRRGFRRGAK